jgi:hypothetical protein
LSIKAIEVFPLGDKGERREKGWGGRIESVAFEKDRSKAGFKSKQHQAKKKEKNAYRKVLLFLIHC